ncbi:hypothetical protein FH5_05202 [Priestia endophytica]|nr:hypothetical protein FH5_05202 [Priestia endophytica]
MFYKKLFCLPVVKGKQKSFFCLMSQKISKMLEIIVINYG